jgi:phage shock protein A
MASIANQVDELEQEYAYERGRALDLTEENDKLKEQISELEDQVAELEEQIEWINTTYPDLEAAFEVKRRLDNSAGVGST